MLLTWIARLFRIPARPSRRQRRAMRRWTPPTFRPRLETLEDRTLLNATLPQPISVDTTGAAMGNGYSYSSALSSLSDNGQYEVFTSSATNLVKNVTVNGGYHVYLRNLTTGATTLVDLGSDGTDAGNGSADSPVISADGRFVAFHSNDNNLTSNDGNGGDQVYVRDMKLGVTYMVSLDSAGTAGGDGGSGSPTIGESNGQLVIAFQSYSDDLVAGDSNTTGRWQIYVSTFGLDSTGAIKSSTPATKLVSVDNAGTNGGNSDSQSPIISKDGSTIGFQSNANNLDVSGGYFNNGNQQQLFLYNVSKQTLTLLSAEPTTTATGNAPSTTAPASLSDNGQYEVFTSSADNLVNNVPGSGQHVYLRDLVNGTTTLVDIDSAGTAAGNSSAGSPVISADGRFVAFVSNANDLTSAGNPNGWSQVYVRDMKLGLTYMVSLDSAGTAGSDNGGSAAPTLGESNGQLVIAFQSSADDLVAGDGNTTGGQQVYVSTFSLDSTGAIKSSTPTTKLVSAENTGTNGGNSTSQNPILSKDGSTLGFQSSASNLNVPGGYFNNSNTWNLFLYNVANPKLTLLTAEPTTAATGNAASTTAPASHSDNGQYEVFTSSATNLVNNVPVSGQHVYRRDLVNSITTLVDIDSAGTAAGGNTGSSPVISSDGRFVAFVSYANDLTSTSTTNGWPQVYVRDMKLGLTYMVSLNSDGNAGSDNGGSSAPTLGESNGQLVIAFQSSAFDLVAGDGNTTGDQQVYVSTFSLDSTGAIKSGTPTTKLVSADNSGTNGANNTSQNPILSKDGSTLGFQSTSTNLNIPGGYFNNSNSWNLFLYNVANPKLTLLTAEPTTAATGNAASTTASASLSDNGQYEVFTSNASNLVNNVPVSGSHIYLRDLVNHTTTLVDIGSSGTVAGDGSAIDPVITADGRYIAFMSTSDNLTSNNTNTNWQIYVRDTKVGATYLVSLDSMGTAGGSNESETPSIADSNGKLFIGYGSLASDLVAGDSNTTGNEQTYVTTFSLDTSGGVQYNTLSTTLISVDNTGTNGANGSSNTPVLSKDGSTLGFISNATNMTGGSTNGSNQIYVYNIALGALKLVSKDSAGSNGGDNASYSFSLSDNGQYLAFWSAANELLSGVTTSQQVYAWNQSTGALTLISVNSSGGAESNAGVQSNLVISGDGSTVAFVSNGNDFTSTNLNPNFNWQVWSRNWLNTSPTTTLVSYNSTGTVGGDNTSGNYNTNLSISDNGQIIAFQSYADDLTSNDSTNSNNNPQIFVRNVSAKTTTLASVNSTGTVGGNGTASTPVLSSDGKTVVFESLDSDLTNAVYITNNYYGNPYNVFARTLGNTPTTSLVSIKAAGLFGGDNTSDMLSLSDNGQDLAFHSTATDLLGGVSNYYNSYNSEVYGWSGNILTLVSVNSSGGADNQYNENINPVISGDGSTIAFASSSNDLTSGNLNPSGYWQVWSRNWLASKPVTTLVSVNSTGTVGGDNTSGYNSNLSISDNGSEIAFQSQADDLTSNDSTNSNNNYQIFVRNVSAKTMTLASVNSTGTVGGNGTASTPVLSSDGKTVVFESLASDLTNAAYLTGSYYNNEYNVFARTLGNTPTTSLVSIKAAGLFGGDNTSDSLTLSDNGQDVAFHSTATDLLGGVLYNGYYGYNSQVYGWTGNILTLVSVNSSGGADSGYYYSNENIDPVISGDGSTIAFVSFSNDLVSGNLNPNGYYQVYSRNWLANKPATTLVSYNSTGTVGGDSTSGANNNLSISDNGQVIAFQSQADDLTSNDSTNSNTNPQIFVRNVAEGTTTLASVNSTGTVGGNGAASTPVLSATGHVVTFNSSATDLVAGVSVPGGNGNVYYTPIAASQFVVTASSPQTAGTSFTITVKAEDASGNVLTGYTGTVHFTSTDGQAALPVDSKLTNGTGTFTVTLKTAGTQTITATDTQDASFTGISNAIAVNPTTASKLAFAQQPSNTGAGASIAPAVTVLIEDKYGNVETGDNTDSVKLALGTGSPSGGKLNGTLTETAKNGVATFADLSIDQVGTGYSLAASSGTLTGATSNAFTITPGAAAQLAFQTQPSNTPAGNIITPAVTVLVEDKFGNIETGDYTDTVKLALGTGSPAGSPAGTLTETVIGGVATFSDLSINQIGTGYTLAASSPTNTNLTNATSSAFNITAAPATQLVFQSQPSNTVAGNTISPSVTVLIEDKFGNVQTNDNTDTVTLAIGTNPNNGFLNGTVTVTVKSGAATFSDLSIDQAGTGYTLVASSSTNTALTHATSNAFNITPAAASQLAFQTQPTNTVAGVTISPTVTVAIEDKFGNVETSDSTDTINMALATGSPAGGKLNGTLTETAKNGLATFSDLSINQAGNGYILSATSSINSTNLAVNSNAFNITPAAATQIAFIQQPTNTVAGATISPAVMVAIEDKFGNVETGDTTDQVSVALGGTSPTGGKLNGTTTVTVSGGVDTFGDLSINQAGTGYTLVASSPTNSNLSSITSNAFNITPAAASQVVFTQQPTNTVAGASISPAVTVAIEDKFGNIETGDTTDQVSVALGGTSPTGGVLNGTVKVTVSNGVATFSNLSIDQAGAGYQLVATSGTLTQATSRAFAITPASASQLVILTQPTNTTAGSSISPAVIVAIEDKFGNIETGDTTDTVQLAIGSNPNNGVLNGTTSITVSNGVATFSTLSIDQAGTGYTLVASSSSNTKLTQATSNAFNITPAAAAKLAFVQQPTNTATGAVINPAVTVAIEDQFGNVETSDNSDQVHIAIGTNPASGKLSGTSPQTVVNGVATFSDLSIDKAGTGYTLVASSGALTKATSNAFNVTSSGPIDVSSDFSITRSGFRYNFALKEFVQTVTITNTSGSTLSGPLALQLGNLPNYAKLVNLSGTSNGSPYIDFLSSGHSLAAGQSVSLVLYFKDPSFKAITYDTQVWQGLS